MNTTFDQRHELLLGWLPHAEPYVLPAANHMLQVQNPEGLASFFARHPVAAGEDPGPR